ncbi:MAG: hypothetical protein ACE5GT_13730 [Rhodospirillales bacterium]
MTILGLSAGLLVAGCGGPDAYVHKEAEFNRQSANFGKNPQNIDSVTICYNKFGTKPEFVANMASAECAVFNKKAEYRRQSFTICPLFTPVAAVYDCVSR